MDHDRFDYSASIKREPIRWPNGARVAVWVIPNIEHYEFEIPSIGMQSFNLVPDIINYELWLARLWSQSGGMEADGSAG